MSLMMVRLVRLVIVWLRMAGHLSVGTYDGGYRSGIVLEGLLVPWPALKYTFGSVE